MEWQRAWQRVTAWGLCAVSCSQTEFHANCSPEIPTAYFRCAQAGDCNLGGSMMLEAKRDLLKRNCISWQREGVGYHQTQCAWPLCIRFGMVRGKVWYCLKSIMTHDCFFIRESPCRCGQSWPIPNTLLWLVEDELSGVELSTGASCALPDFLDICLP